MNKKRILIIGIVAVVLLGGWYALSGQNNEVRDIIVPVTKGEFEIVVTTSGELEAKNSVEVTGPGGLRQAGIYQIKIDRMVPEGTVVGKGDFVASLDKSELDGKRKDAQTALAKIESQYLQTKLDTALEMRSKRDEIVNLEFSLKEQDLELQQSTYEPPATIQKIRNAKEKAQRSLEQSNENYELKRRQSKAKMDEVSASLQQAQRSLDIMNDLVTSLTITAPEPGMVIYDRDWNGRKKAEGSQISVWNPTVASLPDLSVMMSRTFVNEVDIRKISEGQSVRIGLDAFPEKKLTGTVKTVANVGEQKPNSDAKVFEVLIEVQEKDTTLRPAMTTSNEIIAEVVSKVISIPLEAIHTLSDSVSYVFLAKGMGFSKQQVEVGATNENSAVIFRGLTEEDRVYLNIPSNAEDKEVDLLESSVAIKRD